VTSSNNDYWFRILFKVKIYEAAGDSFQYLVNQLCQHSMTGFQSISPWGNWGDGGNDGWVQNEQHYLQVYGPKPTTEWSPVDAAKKSVTDFHKLLNKWPNIKKYSFVLNDRFIGIPAPVADAMEQMKTTHNLEQARPMGSADLEYIFMGLTEDLRQIIVGGIPSCSLSTVDARAVGELLSNLADNIMPLPPLLTNAHAPDFDEKIAFNGLTTPVSEYLRVSSYQASLVDDFLSRRDPGLQQAISEEIKELYATSKKDIPDADPDTANIRYAWMLDRLIPEAGRQHPHSWKAYREAAQIVLAKFFETCDAYEYPDSHSAA
jgi:hypothetical protein